MRLTLTVLIVLLVTNFAVYFSGTFTNLDSGVFLIRHKWQLLRELDEPVDWLILGDSSANQGVNPDLFQTQDEGTVVNLGTVGNVLLIDDVWMLQDYIEEHGVPKNVVIVHVYDMWMRDADTSVFAHMPWDYMSDIGLFSSMKERLELLWFRYVPLYQSEKQVFRAISYPKSMFTQPIRVTSDGFTRVDSPNPEIVAQDIDSHMTRILPEDFILSPTNQLAINELVKLANEHDMNVFIANSPIHEDLVGQEAFTNYFENVSRLLVNLDQSSPNIHYVLRHTPSYDSSVMENVDHVTIEGANLFSSELFDEIRSHTAR